MFRKARLAACTAVIAALALPVGAASAAPSPAFPDTAQFGPVVEFMPGYASSVPTPSNPGGLPANPQCPANYSGPTNLATGCPWYLMH